MKFNEKLQNAIDSINFDSRKFRKLSGNENVSKFDLVMFNNGQYRRLYGLFSSDKSKASELEKFDFYSGSPLYLKAVAIYREVHL